MIDISVVVCTRNRPDKLKNCLNSILINKYKTMELLVVDQSDDEKTAILAKSLNDSKVLFYKMKGVGLGRARNLAIDLSRGTIIAFTDDDCIVEKDWIEKIIQEFSRRPDISALYGRVLPYGKASEGMFCHAITSFEGEIIVDKTILPYNIGHGNNMSFRKSVFLKIGSFEETIGAGTKFYAGEDTDFTLRLMEHGLKLCYSSNLLVYHDKWHTLEESRNLDYKYLLGAAIVFTKHLVLKRNNIASMWFFNRFREIGTHLNLAIKKKDISRLKYALKMYYCYCSGISTSLYLLLTRKLCK
ncbi:MAG: glycosyltransferase family A protein [Candidatus Omnitrophica bacterium]|nr:glycosyltransferase family A protein [Candidatus Omnitrophota bacterium]